MRYLGLLKKLGEIVGAKLSEEFELDAKVQMVCNVDAPAILDLEPVTLTVIIEGTNQPQRIIDGSTFVLSAAVVNGPRADGVTPNAATIFVGGKSVTREIGWPLAPGAAGTPIGGNFAIGPSDLSKWFVTGTAGDVVRVVYLA